MMTMIRVIRLLVTLVLLLVTMVAMVGVVVDGSSPTVPAVQRQRRWFDLVRPSPPSTNSTRRQRQDDETAAANKNTTHATALPLRSQKAMNNSINGTKTNRIIDDNDAEKEAGSSATNNPTSNDNNGKNNNGRDDDAGSSSSSSTPPPPQQSGAASNNNATAPIIIRQRPALFRPQQQQQQQPGRVIVLGRGTPLHPQHQQQQYPSRGRNDLTNGPHDELIEVLGGLAARIVRLGILTWLSRHLMHREETIIPSQHYVWEVVNEKYDRDVKALQTTLRRPPRGIRPAMWRTIKTRFHGKSPSTSSSKVKHLTLANLYRRTAIVIDISTYGKQGDSSNISLEQLPDIVSFLIAQQTVHAFGTDKTTGEPLEVEVILCLASPGGSATSYGKAAAELGRLKQSSTNLSLTVCVDEVAASGGYMMASQADRIVAAPFAIVGSIGVIREGFNFYELCKRYGVQPLVLKSGESKNPISSYGPVSRQDIDLEQVRLKKIHRSFQELVRRARPQISTRIMDGSIYAGVEAYELGLIDDIQTSAEYIYTRIDNGDRVIRLHRSSGGRNRQRNMSILDLLPHVQTFLVRLRDDPAQAVKTMVRLGTWWTLVHELIQTAQKVLR